LLPREPAHPSTTRARANARISDPKPLRRAEPSINVTHITLESQIETMAADGRVELIKLDGSEDPFPGGPNGEPLSRNLTFLCAVVPGAVYAGGTPLSAEP
jgi:hypothetical protein